PSCILGLPPATAALTPTITSTIHSQRGTDGTTPRGIRASHIPATASAALSPIATQPGKNVNSNEMPNTTSSFVPAHSSCIGELPGTGRNNTTGRLRRARRFAGAATATVLACAAVGAA